MDLHLVKTRGSTTVLRPRRGRVVIPPTSASVRIRLGREMLDWRAEAIHRDSMAHGALDAPSPAGRRAEAARLAQRSSAKATTSSPASHLGRRTGHSPGQDSAVKPLWCARWRKSAEPAMMGRGNGFIFGLVRGNPARVTDRVPNARRSGHRNPLRSARVLFQHAAARHDARPAGACWAWRCSERSSLNENNGHVTTWPAEPDRAFGRNGRASCPAGIPVPISPFAHRTSNIQYGSLGVTPTLLEDGAFPCASPRGVGTFDRRRDRLTASSSALTTRRAETTVELVSVRAHDRRPAPHARHHSIDRAPASQLPILARCSLPRFLRAETELVIIVTPYW